MIFQWFEKLETKAGGIVPLLLVLVPLCLLLVPPTGVLLDNEEQYLAQALRQVNPAALPENSALMGGMPHTVFFNALAGPVLDALGMESGQRVLRALVALAFAFALAYLLRVLRLDAIDAIIVMLAFALTTQRVMADEWIFRGVEPKTFAYPLVIVGVAEMLRGRAYRSMLWFAVGAYFHATVAGLWAVFAGLGLLISGQQFRKLVGPGLLFAAMVAPLVIYLGATSYGHLVGSESNAGAGPDASWILTFYRMPYHATPYVYGTTALWHWIPSVRWLPGILLTAAVIPLIYGFMRRHRLADDPRRLGILVMVAVSFVLLAMVASAFDDGGRLGPYLLFRPNSLALFFSLLIALIWVRSLPLALGREMRFAVALLLCAGMVVPLTHSVYYTIKTDKAQRAEQAAFYMVVSNSTQPDDVFLLDRDVESRYLSFERNSGRALLSAHKFVPGGSADIQEWYRRRLAQDQFLESRCVETLPYHADYLILSANKGAEHAAACGKLIFADGSVYLIRPNPAL